MSGFFLSFHKHNTDILALRIYPDDAATQQGLDLMGISQAQTNFQAPWCSFASGLSGLGGKMTVSG